MPPAFAQIVNHCLEKEPEKRFQSVRDLAFALETLSGSGGKVRGVHHSALRSRIRKVFLGALTLAAVVAAGWYLRAWFRPSNEIRGIVA